MLEDSASRERKEALKVDRLGLMARMGQTEPRGPQEVMSKGAPVNSPACFPGSLPGSRVIWQERRGCGPRQDWEEGQLVPRTILGMPF